ncbi:SRPBCC domain-containing protein [Nocardia paucivorans]|uniref:SRPBCC domain-containing protein n=1 Tax=Nocardia paucivorans TaxID=114259 RepID=UPI0002F5DDC1|nr:SRPBCC domain-containing protein [Nocardia paucivorans]
MDDVIEVDAPAEVVWSVLTDVAAYGEWNTFIDHCESTLEVGAPIDMVVRQLTPRPIRMREYIRSHTPGREFSYAMRPLPLGALRSLRSHTVIPLAAERARYESHFELAGWLSPLVGMFFGRGFRRGFPGMTTGVARRAEQLHAG